MKQTRNRFEFSINQEKNVFFTNYLSLIEKTEKATYVRPLLFLPRPLPPSTLQENISSSARNNQYEVRIQVLAEGSIGMDAKVRYRCDK